MREQAKAKKKQMLTHLPTEIERKRPRMEDHKIIDKET